MSTRTEKKSRTSTPTPSAAERPAAPDEARTALDALRSEIDAYPEAKIRRITFDVPRAISIGTASQLRVLPLRDRIVAELPATPIHYVDKLNVYAMAAWYAHLATIPKPSTTLEALKTEAAALRADMLVGAEPLVHRGYFAKETIAKIKEGSGFLDTANDVVALSALYTEAWPVVEHKTIIDWAQVERAAVVGPQLVVALGEKLGFSTEATEAARVRARAVSLFVDVYEELQRAVTYLRWHEDDVASVLPSFYQTGSRRAATDAAPADAPTPQDPTGTPPTT